VAHELEVWVIHQVGDVLLSPGKKVVDTEDVVPRTDQAITQVRSQKTGPAGH
jgi:hypothetical protein